MKEKEIRRLLHHANIRQIEKVAEHPATDEHTKDMLFRKLRNRQTEQIQFEETVSETFTAQEVTPTRWSHYAGIAAALVLVVGSATGAIFWLSHNAPLNPQQPNLSAAAPFETEDSITVIDKSETALNASEELTKELIYSRCTTSLNNLTQLYGSIEIWNSGWSEVLQADIMFDFDSQHFYGDLIYYDPHSARGKCLDDMEQFYPVQHEKRYASDGRVVSFVNLIEWDFSRSDGIATRSDAGSYSDYYVVGCAERNDQRSDSTGFHELVECFQPIDMTEGLLSDKKDWEITGTEICQERECAVIEGTTDVYGIRWNVTHFKIKVDIETGAWLFFEGYGADGTINSYLYTKGMVFGETLREIPVITEEQIDEEIAQGYVMDEKSVQRRAQYLSENIQIATDQ